MRLRARGRLPDLLAPLRAQLPAGSQVYYAAKPGSVTQSGGIATALADERGAGYGPPILFPAGAAYDVTAGTITLNGSTQYGETASDAGFAMTGDFSVVLIAKLPTPGGQCVFFSDGTMAKYLALGMDANNLNCTTAGALSGVNPTSAPGGYSANLRLLMLSHGAQAWTHPITGSERGGRDGSSTPSEYHFLEVSGRGRVATVASNCYQAFAAGNCKLTIGRKPDGTGYVPLTLVALIRIPRQWTYDEQELARTLARAHNIVEDTSKNFAVLEGNSALAGLLGTPWLTLLQGASVSPYTVLPALFPTSTWDAIQDGYPAPGFEGQFTSHTRGASRRSYDLIAGAINRLRAKNIFVYFEMMNDAVLNLGQGNPVFTSPELGAFGFDNQMIALTKMKAAGYICIATTHHKTSTYANTIDKGSPWDTSNGGGPADPVLRGNPMVRLAAMNDPMRKYWREAADALWDLAGNVNFRNSDFGGAGVFYADLSHPTPRGSQEAVFQRGESAYNPAYNADYLSRWGVDLGIDWGPNYVGLRETLEAFV